MDWTGGTRRLYASKGKKNDVIQKQKAFFAKARNAASHGDGLIPDFMRVPSRQPSKDSAYSHSSQSSPANGRRDTARQSHESTGTARHTTRNAKPTGHHRIHKTVKSSHISHAPTTHSPHRNMSDEDRLLFANRKRLLARQDWLGLAPMRPLQLDFPSERDDRVGKRRKVTKPWLQRGLDEQRRQVTPPFQVEPLMSGALQGDNIEIKVGTDAFASQTQPSRASRTSVSTSMRQPSTEFGPLSEESMLLDIEDDGRGLDEPDFSHIQEYLDRRRGPLQSFEGSPNIESICDVTSGSKNRVRGGYYQDLCQNRDLSSGEIQPEHARQIIDPPLHAMPQGPPDPPLQRWQCNYSGPRGMHSRLAEGQLLDQVERQPREPLLAASFQQEPSEPSESVTTSDDERQWRHTMGVRRSPVSIAAVKSDSLHATQSTASYRPGPKNEAGPIALQERASVQHAHAQRPHAPAVSTLRHDSAEYDAKRMDVAQRMLSMNAPRALGFEWRGIPPKPRQQQAEVQTLDAQDEETNDEALWRSFVVGSQQSSSSEKTDVGKAWNADMLEEILPASPTSVRQPRSDWCTLGDTMYEAQSSTDKISHALDSQMFSDDIYANTSMIGHAATIAKEAHDAESNDDVGEGLLGLEDEIQDDFSMRPQASAKPNGHVTTSVLSARRFRTPDRPSHRSQPPIAPGSQFLSYRKRQQSRQESPVHGITPTSGS